MLNIKILGASCSNCDKLYEITTKATASLGAETEITKVSDYAEMMRYGILQTPAPVLNERVVLTGKVPTLAEVTTLVTTALADSAES